MGVGTVINNTGVKQVNNSSGLTVSENATFDGAVAMTGQQTISGSVEYAGGLSGSLQHLNDGTSYIVGDAGVLVVSSSAGQIHLSVDDNVVATVSGTKFTGEVSFAASTNMNGDAFVSGSCTVSGGLNLNNTVWDTDFTLAPSDSLAVVSGNGAAVTATLPAVADVADGWQTIVKDGGGGGSYEIRVESADGVNNPVDGAPAAVIGAAYGFVHLAKVSTNAWMVLNKSGCLT